ncbi:MAG: preprotein translocase subunit SecY [Firmicutes bacterium ADurb.Bin193]|nr:MAG: preprotein translocase subunit SecY [Firmicutes bacterium ADurb.Bin193]
MFQTIRNAWKIPDLRKKLLYTLLMIVVFRLGSFVPVPFISSEAMRAMIDRTGQNSLLSFFDTFSGGAFGNATIFAMSITPYVNASIIMNLLTVAIPALERLSREGEEGRKKIAQFSRYLTVVLGFVQAVGLYLTLVNARAITNPGFISGLTIIITFTAGTAFLMWLGEQINEKGIGNGISLLIFAGIVSRGPDMIRTLAGSYMAGRLNWFGILAILVIAVLVIAAVVAMNNSERRIPVQYSKRVVGRKVYGGQSTHIPLKLLSAGVIPIIFAMSIIAFPGTLASFFGKTVESGGFIGGLLKILSPRSAVYSILYFVLILFFTFFYTAIQFNPIEIANNMKKNGGFIPGLRPGKPTSDYISKVLSRVTIAGAIFLGLIAVFPIAMASASAINISIGGTSVLIAVGVALDTVKQMESQMLMRHYKGFLE